MSARPNADSFGTFLETIQKLDPTTRSRSAEPATPESPGGAEQAPGAAPSQPMELLALLAQESPLAVTELLSRSGLAFDTFADALKAMRDANLIAVSGPPEAQRAELTSSGKQVA